MLMIALGATVQNVRFAILAGMSLERESSQAGTRRDRRYIERQGMRQLTPDLVAWSLLTPGSWIVFFSAL